jgi:hypothetical protein
MRSRLIAAIAAVIASSPATAANPYYGPMSGPFGTGYKQNVEKDGSLRIVTEYHSRDPYLALNVALYRAAELARQAGSPYVQMLGGSAYARNGVAVGTAYARPTTSPLAPTTCRRAKRCYTADVAAVLRALGGPYGNQPGIAQPSGIDSFGRSVSGEGFGVGAVAWLER